MLTSPQTVTVATVPYTMNKIESNKNDSTYSTDDQSYQLIVSHQFTKNRQRHLARVNHKVVAADPLTAENSYQSAGIYLVIDEPLYGFSDTQLLNDAKGLLAWLSDSNINAILALRH